MRENSIIEPPVVVLVRPQMGENIGAAARAMANFGLSRLRLVQPRDGWPNPAAVSTSAGALEHLEEVSCFASVRDAIADCRVVWATSARRRRSLMPHVTLGEATAQMISGSPNVLAAVLFGPENSGLNAQEIANASTLVEIEVTAAFASLNLGASVGVFAHQWRLRALAAGTRESRSAKTRSGKLQQDSMPATRSEWHFMIDSMIELMDEVGFWHPPQRREQMIINMRDMMHRAHLNRRDVRAVRGMLSLIRKRLPRSKPVDPASKSSKSSKSIKSIKSIIRSARRRDCEG